jgi:hypothetical protein
MDDELRNILEANAFLQKITFMKAVLKGWIKLGRLGERLPLDQNSASEGGPGPFGMFWEGVQERPQPGASGGRFVWVTVGAPGGDAEYRSISLKKPENELDDEMDALRKRLRMLGTPS